MKFADYLAIVVIIVALLGFALRLASAHDAPSGFQYDPQCCGGAATSGDCAPVPDAAIREAQGGYSVLIRPGEHPMAHAPVSGFLAHGDDRIRPSGDDRRHACISRSGRLLCVYIQSNGF